MPNGTCKHCGEMLGGANRVFKERGKNRAYYLNRCRPCLTEAGALLRRLKKEHPMPPAGTPCACCGRIDKLFCDHSHASGEYRGWICKNCNSGLGLLGDSVAGLERALAYLRSSDQNACLASSKPHGSIPY